ncbi:MAG: thiol-disulfide oxidoreductase DCC family protein [Bacteroidetes bacterium]|nr:thiol-disulfide oxidoreductase DCC family protein [Bacteroidota bacterium]
MTDPNKIVLFDGVCNLCEGSVQFLLKRDKQKILRYASLQSDSGAKLLSMTGLDERFLKSIVFIDEGEAFTESDAVLRICKYLPQPWNALQYFRFVPKWIRDPVYRFIAQNRYRWFGKKEQCVIPQAGVMERFLS